MSYSRQIRDAAQGRWLDILASLAPEIRDAISAAGSSKHFSCPVHGGKDGFRMFSDAAETGGAVCNTCGTSKDGFSLLVWLRNQNYDHVVEQVGNYLGITKNSPAAATSRSKKQSSTSKNVTKSTAKSKKTTLPTSDVFEIRSKLVRRWQQTGADPRIWTYLRSRGISIDPPSSLRLHPEYDYFDADGKFVGVFPCIVSQVMHSNHGLVALHRIYLEQNGSAKANVDAPKKLTSTIFDGAFPGSAIRLYPISPSTTTAAIAEGIETAIACHQATGLPVWSTVNSGNMAVVELPAHVREVVIFADQGEVGQKAATTAAFRFLGEGRTVKILTPDSTKSNADWLDALNEHGPDKIREALDDAKPFESGQPEINRDDDDPARLARLFLADYLFDSMSTLRYWRQEFYVWDGRKYRSLSGDELQSKILLRVQTEFDRLATESLVRYEAWKQSQNYDEKQDKGAPKPKKVYPTLLAAVMAHVRALTIADRAEWNQWIGHDGKMVRRCLFSMGNGILDIESLIAGRPIEEVLLPHSPRWFCQVSVTYAYDCAARCPRWLEAITYNLSEDPDLIAILQEWFGYSLIQDTNSQKFLILQGEGGNGKSVTVAALEAMVGSDNCSHVSLEDFGSRFQLAPTMGKLLNIVGDVGDLDRIAEGHLKRFVSGDTQTVDRKNISAIEMTPTAKLVVCCNDPPRMRDKSSGPYRRIILLPFIRQIEESRRVMGMDKPTWWEASGELPGILNWSLMGLMRLLANDMRFTESKLVSDLLDEYRRENNPAREFITDHVYWNHGALVGKSEIFGNYVKWCDRNRNHPLGMKMFGKELKRLFPGISSGKLTSGFDRVHAWLHVSYSETPVNLPDEE